jgi:hypothetical protein
MITLMVMNHPPAQNLIQHGTILLSQGGGGMSLLTTRFS